MLEKVMSHVIHFKEGNPLKKNYTLILVLGKNIYKLVSDYTLNIWLLLKKRPMVHNYSETHKDT